MLYNARKCVILLLWSNYQQGLTAKKWIYDRFCDQVNDSQYNSQKARETNQGAWKKIYNPQGQQY